VVINRQAGSVVREGGAVGGVRAGLERLSDRIEMNFVEPGSMADVLTHLLKQGAERIAVGGGDGTLATAADTIRRVNPEAELVCLPLGTHNHFAKDLGAPLDPDLWFDWLKSGRVRKVDLGEADGNLFLNNLSIGLYPALVKRRQNLADERLLGSKRLATLAAALSIWRALPGRFTVHYEADGDYGATAECLRVRLLLISNNQYADEPMTPLGRSTLSGGCLTLYAPKTVRLLHALPMAFQALYGDLESSRHVHLVRGSSFRLELAQPQNTIAMDGELVECGSQIEIRLLRRSLKVVLPEIDD
jgi:diacylglycerol kinase family enzyme